MTRPISLLLSLIALSVLAEEPSPSDLIQQLGDESWETREEATKALVAIGPVALDALQEALDHPDPEVRIRVRRILSDPIFPVAPCHRTRVRRLAEALTSDDGARRRAGAVDAAMESEGVRKDLVRVLEVRFPGEVPWPPPATPDEAGTGVQGLLALAPESLSAFSRLLLHADDQKRAYAALACQDVRLRRRESVPPLLGALGDRQRTVRVLAELALRGITFQDFHGDAARYAAWWEQEGARGREAWAFAALRGGDTPTRRRAAQELAASPSGESLEGLVRALSDRDPLLRAEAGYYLWLRTHRDDGINWYGAPFEERQRTIAEWEIWIQEGRRFTERSREGD